MERDNVCKRCRVYEMKMVTVAFPFAIAEYQIVSEILDKGLTT